MPELKLDKLPDRTPVKITITVSPALNHALGQYAAIYARAYGEKEKIEDLIPFLLEAFLDADRGFQKARKAMSEETPPPSDRRQHRQSLTPQTEQKEA
jgi:hypothetical protein